MDPCGEISDTGGVLAIGGFSSVSSGGRTANGTLFARVTAGYVVNNNSAGALTYLGDKLGVELYFAAIVAFGVRIFDNLAVIRRHLL